jgi:hypothetical protein
MMMPKWFDKSVALTPAQNIDQLRLSLALAAEQYRAAGRGTAFDLHAAIEPEHHARARANGLNGLIASFGLALIDRAVIDALCRLHAVSAVAAVRANLLGIDVRTAPDLLDFDLPHFLATRPAETSIAVRHTIGLGDALHASEIAEPLDDGLPQSLDQVIARYGHTWFKVKVSGQPEADTGRLVRIAAVLDRLPHYAATLDGNEQCASPEVVNDLLDRIEAEPRLERLRENLAFLEQPIARAATLTTPMHAIAARIGLEVDEADAEIGVFPTAKAQGYTGISSKSCKGFYRAVLNAARVEHWRAQGVDAFISAEDLTTQAGIGIQQDLVLASLIGARHIERNGHHYVDGMAGAPLAEQQAFLAAHGDLYTSADGRARLAITNGQLSLASMLAAPGLGSAVEPDWAAMDNLTMGAAA